MTAAIQDKAVKYHNGGFRLCTMKMGKKGPEYSDWQTKPIEPTMLNGNSNIGSIHKLSGTFALDIDHKEAKSVLERIGIDTDTLYANNLFQTVGNPDRPAKIWYRFPQELTPTVHGLTWPHPKGERTPNGSLKTIPVFELRAKGQDVLPPSIHPDTKQPYYWVNDTPESVDQLPTLPRELVNLFRDWKFFLPEMSRACPWLKK